MAESFLSVAQAEARAAEAQRDLAAARARQATVDQFPKVDELYAVMAVGAQFDQFVSYEKEGELIAVFADEERANEYAAENAAPPGKFLVVQPVAQRS